MLVADDHPVVRERLKRLIAECADMELVGEAASGEEALRSSMASRPDVLLLDVSMPGPGVLETLARVHAARPGLKVLAMSIHAEAQYAARCLRAGAAGYLSKERAPAELAAAIRRVHQGHRFVTRSLAQRLAPERTPDAPRPSHAALSRRELHILRLLGAGKSVAEIAGELQLRPKTVSTYRSRVLKKMRMRSDTELVRYVLDRGLGD